MTSLLQKQDGSGTYTFASRPRPVQPTRKKYRDPFEAEPQAQSMYGNIMYDRRIVRGNTYAQNTLPATAQPDPIELQKQQEGRRRAVARKRAKDRLKPHTPEAVAGRKHIDVQTELYLEELTDRVEESDIFTQTDAFLDRPPTPLFVPAKTGIDVATQILEGELFDFDIEVKPILEVLIGKTVEQALLEVMEEEELANLRAHQRRFEELRNAELVETQRLEEQERRHREEKHRRMKQQLEVLKREKETTDKVAARAFAQSYLQDLVPSVFGTLHEHGYFYDPVERDVETHFMPSLMDGVVEELNKVRVARAIIDCIIRETVMERTSIYAKLDLEVEKKIRAALESGRKKWKTPVPIEEGGESDTTESKEVPVSGEESVATEGDEEAVAVDTAATEEVADESQVADANIDDVKEKVDEGNVDGPTEEVEGDE